MKQYAVIGLGDFGMYLAESLADLGVQVLAIDIDKKRIEEIKDKVTLAAIADVRDKKLLVDLISPDLDAVIISLGKLEENVLATLYIKEIGVQRIFVKPMNEDHGHVLKAVGATELINPDKEMARGLAMKLTNDNLMEHIPLAEGYGVVEIALPEKFIGKSLGDLDLRKEFGVMVLAVNDVMKGESTYVPEPGQKFGADCSLVVLGKNDDINRLKEFKS